MFFVIVTFGLKLWLFQKELGPFVDSKTGYATTRATHSERDYSLKRWQGLRASSFAVHNFANAHWTKCKIAYEKPVY